MNEKILIVDDDQGLTEALSRFLQGEGYRVIVAHDGEEALHLFRKESPDLVFLDPMMPKISGQAVLRTIRSQSQLPVVIISCLGDASDVVTCWELGADYFIPKPFPVEELLVGIEACLRKKAARPQAAMIPLKDLEIDWGRAEVFRDGEKVPPLLRSLGFLKCCTRKGVVSFRESSFWMLCGGLTFMEMPE